jgi:hypothetical protein
MDKESCLGDLGRIMALQGAAGSGVSASQGPRVQFHAPKKSSDVYLLLETSSCCPILVVQINRHIMNSVFEYLPPAEGWLPKWIFFVRLQGFSDWQLL